MPFQAEVPLENKFVFTAKMAVSYLELKEMVKFLP